MTEELTRECDRHPDPFDCPDRLIVYVARFDEYGIIVHDGGGSHIAIAFCPFCGAKLPESKRALWFDRLKAIGVMDPLSCDIPKEFETDEWFRKAR